MRRLLFLSFLLCFSLSAFSSVPSNCYSKSEIAVKKHTTSIGRNYDKDGFGALECVVAPNLGAILCDVGASKGDGAAYDSYRVVLNKSCTKVFRVELTGEE